MKTAVIGIGNVLFQDEGVGVHVIHKIARRYELPDNCELVDGGTKGLDLLPIIEEQEALILVDAVDFNEEPGFIKLIEDEDMKAYLDLKFSVHQIGIPDMLFAMHFKGIKPPKICLLGIQPGELEMKNFLTPKIDAKVDELVDIVISRLFHWGIEAVARTKELEIELSPELRNVSSDPV